MVWSALSSFWYKINHYSPLPEHDEPSGRHRIELTARRHSRSQISAICLTILLIFCLSLGLYEIRTALYQHPFKLQESWAQYSPYFPVAEYESLPRGCQVVQANIIQRHGARYPTANAGAEIEAAVAKLKNASQYTDKKLNFLVDYTYDLGHDDLLSIGAAEAFKSGEDHFRRYSHLVNQRRLPFVRASASERVILSATNWTAGFAAASGHMLKPKLSVTIPETEGQNNTLDDNMCPNAGDGDEQTDKWLSVYGPPITSRLNKAAPGAHLTSADIYSLMSLCPFETVAKDTRSPFCKLFTDDEFRAFEYSGDLDKFYGTGYGQDLGRVQGVGYVNELIARLTSKPVFDHTQTNSTLDSSPVTFPLNQTIYIDFSHDNQMIAIYVTLGLFAPLDGRAGWLDPEKVDEDRTWVTSKLVPFSGRMITERVACGYAKQELVRVLVNDAVQPLEFCGANEHGLCTLDAFVQSQGYARSGGNGDFEKCFE